MARKSGGRPGDSTAADRLDTRRKKYMAGDKRKTVQKKYLSSEKGKESHKRHTETSKWKLTAKKYSQSDKGKEAQKRYYEAKKRREALMKEYITSYEPENPSSTSTFDDFLISKGEAFRCVSCGRLFSTAEEALPANHDNEEKGS